MHQDNRGIIVPVRLLSMQVEVNFFDVCFPARGCFVHHGGLVQTRNQASGERNPRCQLRAGCLDSGGKSLISAYCI